MRRLGVVSVLVALTAGVLALAPGPAGAARVGPSAARLLTLGRVPALPASIAALGDSITQAFDALGLAGGFTPHSEPVYSWATGTAGVKSVDSQYLRLLAVDSKTKSYNDSVSGAKVGDLAGQVTQAVKQKAQYVVILIGANDACTSTIAGMTPVATFTKTFTTDLATLEKGLPKGAHISLYSIPNLFQLWTLFHKNATAESRWSLGICQSMLSTKNTAADRTKVLDREEAFNSALAAACKKYSNCRWDNLAVFNDKFTASDVNNLDYFHPSVVGQNHLAAVTWPTSWWPADK